MLCYHQTRLFAVPCLLLLACTIGAGPAHAGYALDLPQLHGTHVDTTIVFSVATPRLQNMTSLSLELSGTQTVGTRNMCHAPPYWRYTGAEVVADLRLVESPELGGNHGESEISGETEDWSLSLILHPVEFFSVFGLGGTMEVEFSIGEVFLTVLCYEYITLPITTIESARIVTDGSVSVEQSTWGAVKRLYK